MSRLDRTIPSRTSKTTDAGHRHALVERDSAARAFLAGGRWTSADGRVQVGFLGARVTAQNDKIAHRTEIKSDGSPAGQRAAAELHSKHSAAGARLTRDESSGKISGVILPYSVAESERKTGGLSSQGLREGRQLTRSQAQAAQAKGCLPRAEIDRAKEQVRGFKPQEVAKSTRDDYAKKAERMERTGQQPESIAKTRESYYAYRAAAIFQAKNEIKNGLSDRAAALKSGDKAGALLAEDRIKSGLLTLEKNPPGFGDSRDFERTNANAVRAERSENSTNKAPSLADKPANWRDQVFAQAAPRDRDALAALQHTGARPAEMAKGVRVSRTPDGGAKFVISGAKSDDLRGFDSRSISVSRDTLEQSAGGRHLLQKLDEKGHAFVRPEGKNDAFSQRVAAAGERAGMSEISAYSYRNEFKSDLERSGADKQTIAQALGHRQVRSQAAYGGGSSGGGGIASASAG